MMLCLSPLCAKVLRDPFLPLFITNPITVEEKTFGETFIYQPMKYLLDPALIICVEPKMLVVSGTTLREGDWIDEQLKLVYIGCDSYTVSFAELEIVLPYGSTAFSPVLVPSTGDESNISEVNDEF